MIEADTDLRNTDVGQEVVELAEEHAPVDPEYFNQTATFANWVAPEVRRIAGFKDATNRGTYSKCPDWATHELANELFDLFYEEASAR